MRHFILNFAIIITCTIISTVVIQGATASKYWVFFKDKQPQTLYKASNPELSKEFKISDKAIKRRSKVLAADNLIDHYDLPIDAYKIQALSELGLKPLVQSKWLNAVSIFLTPQELTEVKKLDFVKKVQPVAKGTLPPAPELTFDEPALQKQLQTYNLDYGNSLTQNELINVPAVHDFGINGEGVIIGVIDSGFKHGDHEAFQDLKLIAEKDFINDDDVTENEDGQDRGDQHTHGTQTLSLIAGFKEGELIGSAYNANILLAKTEYIPTETAIEEDYWVAGIEWLESQGADIVTTSLGYTTFDDTNYYTQADMDGNTAVTTIAADLAVKKGVVVITSAGNEGDDPWGIIGAPADGDSVITVGGVNSNNGVAGFSSRGPTADGRIKPDIVTMGVSNYLAFPTSKPGVPAYGRASGTSFSCPSAAGVAALILAAHPYLAPLQVRNALRSTADNALNPNNDIGWGLVDAYDAVLFHGPAFSSKAEIAKTDNIYTIKINADSKNGVNPNEVYFGFKPLATQITNELKMTVGAESKSFEISIPDSVISDTFNYYFKLTDLTGITAYHPYNAPDSYFTHNSFLVDIGEDSPHPDVFQLAQNFPNPFNPRTQIVFELKVDANTSLTIFNRLGQEVKLLENKHLPVGQHKYFWDGTDNDGVPVVSGIYFYELKAGKYFQVKKMALIR